MNNFCVYFHIHQGTPVPVVFYVGKGKKKRPGQKTYRTTFWHNVVNKYGYDILVQEGGLSEEEAFELEKHYIKWFGRRNDPNRPDGTLVNLTEGGEGQSGHSPSEETRAKMREIHSTRPRAPHSAETKARLSAALTGKVVSRSTRQKQSKAGLGRKCKPFSKEHLENMRLANLGKKLSPEHKAAISASGRGRRHTEETKAKCSAAHKGKLFSPEHLENIRKAQRARREREKNQH